jgi:DNA-binding NarL/FixJ family response regulator
VTLPEVGLLLSDLDRWSLIQTATLVVERIRVPWVALTTSPRGPFWGGLLAAGVEVVLPGDTGLEHISDLLLSVAQSQVATPADERFELEAAWREMRARHGDVTERIGQLTPREREVLHLMYEGSSVARIAETFEVTPATVRSQVKAVLRKLDVNTQLAAVAAFDDALDLRAMPHLPRPQHGDPPTTG